MKRGFTIVEMLIVISVIGVLMGIVTTAARNSIKDARSKRYNTMATVLEQGMATYYQRYGKWPDTLERKVAAGDFGGSTETYNLSPSEVDDCFRAIVKCSTEKKNPVMDVTGLFVAPAGETRGMDFNAARKGTSKRSNRKIGVGAMVFGYPARNDGKFVRYGIRYSITGDSVKVY